VAKNKAHPALLPHMTECYMELVLSSRLLAETNVSVVVLATGTRAEQTTKLVLRETPRLRWLNVTGEHVTVTAANANVDKVHIDVRAGAVEFKGTSRIDWMHISSTTADISVEVVDSHISLSMSQPADHYVIAAPCLGFRYSEICAQGGEDGGQVLNGGLQGLRSRRTSATAAAEEDAAQAPRGEPGKLARPQHARFSYRLYCLLPSTAPTPCTSTHHPHTHTPRSTRQQEPNSRHQHHQHHQHHH
jgi:hypothetical protein